MSNIKENHFLSKIEACYAIRDNVHSHTSEIAKLSQGFYHYAIVLPSRQNSGWWQKVGYRN
jgi:hypothetical protein